MRSMTNTYKGEIMSTTKRLIDSLPKEDQDVILGLFFDEWTESADNAPTQNCARCESDFSVDFEGVICPSCIEENGNNAEWAQALTDETEDEIC